MNTPVFINTSSASVRLYQLQVIYKMKYVSFFFTEVSGCKTRAMKANKDITEKLEITDKNTTIKHQLSLCYYPWILNCDYFEFKH